MSSKNNNNKSVSNSGRSVSKSLRGNVKCCKSRRPPHKPPKKGKGENVGE